MINSTGGAGFTRQYSFDGNVFGNDNILPMAQNNNYRTVVRDVNNCLAFDTVALFIPELFIDSISYLENLLCSDDSTDLIFLFLEEYRLMFMSSIILRTLLLTLKFRPV